MQRIRIQIKNWSDYQAKARTGRKWKYIQVHRALLTDFHFRELLVVDRWNLIGLWLLADPKTGIIDMEEKEVLFMLCSKSLVLENLVHFIDILAAECEQTAAVCGQSAAECGGMLQNVGLEVEREREREKEKEKSIGTNVADRRDGFNKFWDLYPSGKKHNKTKCRDKFMKLTRDIHPDEIVNGLIPWIGSPDWTKDSGQFIPHASTFLNDARWESPPESKNISQSTGRPEGSAL